MKPDIPSIDQLKEMPLPEPVSYAPQTWGWWALLAFLIIALVVTGARRYWQWRRDRYRREALARLEELQQRSNDLSALRELPELLKRVALSMPSASPVGSPAALGKEDWQAFLQQHSKQPLPADFSQQLSLLAYAPDATLRTLPLDQRQQLFSTCKTWVERHHVAA